MTGVEILAWVAVAFVFVRGEWNLWRKARKQ